MTILSTIKEKLKGSKKADGSVKVQGIAEDTFVDEKSNAVTNAQLSARIVDVLIKWRGAQYRPQQTWTLAELAAIVTNAIGSNNICVLVCDNRANVPTLKSGTQKDRAIAGAKADKKRGIAPAEAYPKGAYITEDGQVSYTVKGEDEDGDEAEFEVTELLSLNRLGKSRWYGSPRKGAMVECSNLGNDIWEAFYPFLHAHVMNPSNITKQLMFDHALDHVAEFRRNLPDGPILDTHMPHDLGESDTAHVYWLRNRFDGLVDAVHFDSSDGDNIAIYACYHDFRPAAYKQRTRVWWHCGPDGAVCDLGLAMERVLRYDWVHPDTGVKLRFPTARSFGLACILGGTDMVDRSRYAPGFTFFDLVIAFLSMNWVMLNRTAAKSKGEAHPSIFLCHFLQVLYTRKFAKAIATAFARHEKKSAKSKAKCIQVYSGPTPGVLLTIPQIREICREKEAKARVAAAKKHAENQCAFDQKTHDMLFQIPRDDPELLAAFHERRAGELAELNKKYERKVKAKLKACFPELESIEWSAQCIMFNYNYWLGASLGKKPAEPIRPRNQQQQQQEDDEEEDEDDDDDDEDSEEASADE